MSAYRYYSNEKARHRDLLRQNVTKEEAIVIIKTLCKMRGLPMIQVLFHKKPAKARSAWSWYQQSHIRFLKKGAKRVQEHISMAETMLNPLDLAHEWAHYAHNHDYELRKRLAKPKLIQPERSHGPQHLALTELAVAYLRKNGWRQISRKNAGVACNARDWVATIVASMNNPETLTDSQRSEVDSEVRQRFMDSLPLTLTCGCCHKESPRERFGARIMARDARGLPQRVTRQPRCIQCRNVKKPALSSPACPLPVEAPSAPPTTSTPPLSGVPVDSSSTPTSETLSPPPAIAGLSQEPATAPSSA